MTPLLERNEQFAAAYTPGPLGPRATQVVIVTCLDHRVDPAITLGLRLGDAVVIRNAGGRVTPGRHRPGSVRHAHGTVTTAYRSGARLSCLSRVRVSWTRRAAGAAMCW